MTTTIGKLNVQISASSAGVAETMNAVSDKTIALRKRVEESNTAIAASSVSSSKAGMAFQELARGVEDAASVYGTSGLAGALRASGNNISQFASIISPAAGAVAGLGVAIGTVLIPKLFQSDAAAKELAISLGSVSAKVQDLRSSMSAASELRQGLRGLTGAKSSEDAANARTNHEANAEDLKAQLDDIAAARKELEKNVERNKVFKIQFNGETKTYDFRGLVSDEEAKRRDAMRDELNLMIKQQREVERRLENEQKLTAAAEARVRTFKAKEQLDKEQADAETAAQQRLDMSVEMRRKQAEEMERISDIAADLNKTLDPNGSAVADIAKQFKERRDSIAGALGLSKDERNSLLGKNRQALEAELRKHFDSGMPQASAPSALLRGSAGAFNAGINANLRKQRENEIAANTKKTADEIIKGNQAIVSELKARPGIAIGSF